MKTSLLNQNFLFPFDKEETLFCFDFDGTLSPIVSQAQEAFMTKEIEEIFEKLCQKYFVCIITGRSLQDIKPRLPKNVQHIVGNHGLEGLLSSHEENQFKIFTENKISSLKYLETTYQGIYLENKIFSFAIHYRNSSIENIENIIEEILRKENIFENTLKGKKVFNILPNIHIDKYFALCELKKKYHKKYAFFIGDDITDESVFKNEEKDNFYIKVGHEETFAPFYIQEQKDIEFILKSLLNS